MTTDNCKRVIVFSGTTEGRQLSEKLEKNKIPHTVLVATEYGELMQPKGEYTYVLEGRKDIEEIKSLTSDARVVVDATHPYAKVVTDNIKKALEGSGKKLIRVLRDESFTADNADLQGADISFFESTGDLKRALENTSGNILFTTGSKDLKDLCSGIQEKSRVYARVLPSAESLMLCEEAGVRSDHVIAMMGPFSKELNLSLLKQYNISLLVTKESGKAGGYPEKLAACLDAGVKVFCIKRPTVEIGVSPDRAFEMIAEVIGERKRTLTVNIVGAGMGSYDGLTACAQNVLKRSDVVFGASRLLEGIEHPDCYPLYISKDIKEKLKELMEAGSRIDEVTVLFSGDIGFYSGASKFEKGLSEWEDSLPGIESLAVKRFPGISSVSFLSIRLGVSYEDACLISLHGRNKDADIKEAAKRILYSKKSFVLLSSRDDLSRLSAELKDRGFEGEITVAERLSYEDERIDKISLEEAVNMTGKGLLTLYIENHKPAKRLLIPVMEDEEFERNKTPMTKALIRHEVIRRLLLKEGDVLYDIGSGTGSIAIEAAGLSEELFVYSFEMDRDAIEIQKRNIEKFGRGNVELVEGEAPDSLIGRQAPDSVFIGGTKGKLSEILWFLKSLEKRIRVVITAISLETMEEISGLYEDGDVKELDIKQIFVSGIVGAGKHHLMKAENAVMVASFYLGKA